MGGRAFWLPPAKPAGPVYSYMFCFSMLFCTVYVYSSRTVIYFSLSTLFVFATPAFVCIYLFLAFLVFVFTALPVDNL